MPADAEKDNQQSREFWDQFKRALKERDDRIHQQIVGPVPERLDGFARRYETTKELIGAR